MTTVPTPNFDRDIGALQATVAMLADAMKNQALLHDRQMSMQHEQAVQMIADFKEMVGIANKQIGELKIEIAAMKSLIDQAKGGWKILVGVGTISAAIGAVIAKIGSFIWMVPKT
jgi:hypothetical protein